MKIHANAIIFWSWCICIESKASWRCIAGFYVAKPGELLR